MKFTIYDFPAFAPLRCGTRFTICSLVLAAGISIASGQTPDTNSLPIDLATTLRLVGARNLDIKIAQENLDEAMANHQSAVEQFFPWVAPGITSPPGRRGAGVSLGYYF